MVHEQIALIGSDIRSLHTLDRTGTLFATIQALSDTDRQKSRSGATLVVAE